MVSGIIKKISWDSNLMATNRAHLGTQIHGHHPRNTTHTQKEKSTTQALQPDYQQIMTCGVNHAQHQRDVFAHEQSPKKRARLHRPQQGQRLSSSVAGLGHARRRSRQPSHPRKSISSRHRSLRWLLQSMGHSRLRHLDEWQCRTATHCVAPCLTWPLRAASEASS
jgi:hypothetical protein